MARWQLGEAYLFKGMYGEADAEFRKMLSLSRSRLALTYDAYFEGRMGSRPEALRLIEEAKGEESHPAQGPYFIAAAYTGLGDNDQAIAWLEKAFGDGEPFLWRIKVDPVFDSLRSDPRFADLLRRLNLRQ
jgi:tetratricopeptide (TPR) repeat protein